MFLEDGTNGIEIQHMTIVHHKCECAFCDNFCAKI